ncbi:MAG: HAMP domain-containing histidine kinase [Cloacibacterium sp.]|nr:HAMP domain-containing histidine kinase [Cloacibacterium sp.]
MKHFTSYINRWIVFVLITLVVAGFAVASTLLIQQLRKQESERIKVFATAMKFQQGEFMTHPQVAELVLSIVEDNTSIPVIVTDRFNNPIGLHRNIPEETLNDSQKLRTLIKDMGETYTPFEVKMPNGENQYIYYSNSRMLDNLQFYPLVLALLIGTYLLFSFWFYRTVKRTDENYLWAGLAKETAHQIGTPLSSMIGWIEIMKLEHSNHQGIKEIEKDINRLTTISERFSKIGSIPELNDLNLKETLQINYDYLKSRISNKVHFTLHMPQEDVLIPHSKVLMSWVIENLVKNAVDAMKGEGDLSVSLIKKNKNLVINFKDSGCGMTHLQMRNAFKPGYSTKQRGWGLGLSLSKRVINEYHKGDLKIAHSEVGKGTTFRIILENI